MAVCPFLTTFDENIKCFSECVFNVSVQVDEECPFKRISGKGINLMGKDFMDSLLIEDENEQEAYTYDNEDEDL